MTLAFCWAHVRRRFYELAAAGPAPIASEALRRIAELYKIEDAIRGHSADERSAARQESSRPIIADLEPWLREKLGLISQKTKLAERSDIRSPDGKDSRASSMTDASSSTPIPSSGQSAQSRSTARTPSLPALTAAPSTGRSSLR